MNKLKIIEVEHFCNHYGVPTTFIRSLVEYELIDTIVVDDVECLPGDRIEKVEQLLRLHYDLNINFEGLDVVSNLIAQINTLQEEVRQLKNKLEFFEE